MRDSSDVLREAFASGDVQRLEALIKSGADIHYKRDRGYDALLDAVHLCDDSDGPRLLELLAWLVAHGVDLTGVSEYGESALRVLSRIGRFDGVQFLLEAGADKGHLQWTPLMEAVALGSFADVQRTLEQGAALEDRDWWDRTAWLIAVLIGDIPKAMLLREHGASATARGRCGCPALFYAIKGHHAEMLRWLLREGSDVHESDDFGTTALITAVEEDDLECVEILLDAGANVEVDANGTAISRAGSRDVIRRLLEAGANPADLSYTGQRLIVGLPVAREDVLSALSADEIQAAITRYFGKSNPEKMHVPFWEAMIRSGASGYAARCRFEETYGTLSKPAWCAQRYGQSWTLLPDGRAVQIGGEHEDWYDPDFCIYNDVFVHGPAGTVAIYGYPESVFPPTDFHSATLIGNFIYVIGSLGYHGTRVYGHTPMHRLDVTTLRMDHLETSGETPGWIYKHRAIALNDDEIRVWGGTVVTKSADEEEHEENICSFVLDLRRREWRRDSTTAGRS